MKTLKIIGTIVFLVTLMLYLVVFGGPIRRGVKAGNCEVRYTYYLTNNIYCNWRTHGHCADNYFERYNAIASVANCLWAEYISSADPEMIRQIKELIKDDEKLLTSWISKSVVERVADDEKFIFGELTIE